MTLWWLGSFCMDSLMPDRPFDLEDRRRIRDHDTDRMLRGLSPAAPWAAMCRCGHERRSHFRERGECMASTAQEVWACACHEFGGLS